MGTKRYKNNKILIYGDLHFPYQHKEALEFLADINADFKPDRVIDIGDTLDNYALSRYPKSPSADNVVKELKKARKQVTKLGAIFPNVSILKSNHCERGYQRATVAGIPREFLIPYSTLIGAPDGWKWYDDLTLTIDKSREQVFFIHTKAGTTLNLAKSLGCSVVVGHKHNLGGVQYFRSPHKRLFAVDTGCLVSDKGYPFEYNKISIIRPMRSIALIDHGVPMTIPFK